MQGIKMFKRRFYEQAMKCFSNAEEEQLKKRTEGYLKAEKASKFASEAESIETRLTDF